MSQTKKEYGQSTVSESQAVSAPEIDYLPPRPKRYRPKIGLIGAGGISEYHLRAYRRMGLDVEYICDLDIGRARKRQSDFYPDTTACDDYRRVLDDETVEVVDITTHPEQRVEIVRAAIQAGKHVLSQKPFVTDIETGRTLVDEADRRGVRIAVNQNGRWAPHFNYIYKAVRAGVIGELSSIDFTLCWDHTWTRGTPFENIHHLLLYDFAIHWFDIVMAILGDHQPRSVYASVRRNSFQLVKPPFLGHVVIDCEQVQARIGLNAYVQFGQEDRTVVSGRLGTIRSFGPGVNKQTVELVTHSGTSRPVLRGSWFENGFEGTMGELLCSIEENRIPWNNARDNLKSLRLCFAAMNSADTGQPVDV